MLFLLRSCVYGFFWTQLSVTAHPRCHTAYVSPKYSLHFDGSIYSVKSGQVAFSE